ncbi:Cysteine desulfurase, SufS subfamily protein [Isoalcanivorax pacificus W11-5]|uniref:Cysteine desulfurase n=1 Tax=Isoalcanivorax pacificus W11-5 TaxID=391936 RepID=A0A0B4XJE5_9GAMM|nr:cysteine desulfurase [Isoalcanivorax pacificus]AJD47166.1 Cysteine desulfurase, SufS subfamily protein [Isoalcanivorax pacificus W11-5]
MNAALPAPNLDALRATFPILASEAYGKPLVYLDNAATTQKPRAVIEAIEHYYLHTNSNVHRGAHYLGDLATAALEDAREKVAAFLNARREEVIWTRGTTEGINLVAHSFGGSQLKAGDEVLISSLEHHANIVPWQQVCARTGATLRVIPLAADASLDLSNLDALINERTRIVAVVHVSNALGVINPVAEIIRRARAVGATVLLDAAQAVAHFPVDVQALDCDFLVFSGHKLFGPTGIGVLYGRQALLETMPPYQTGGEMIETVTFEASTWNQLPYKFEAGTPHIAGAVGLGAAIDWLNAQDRQAFLAHEEDLRDYVTERARAFPGLRIIGDTPSKVATLSFLLDGAHPNDVGTLLDQQGVAVRTGHHCTMPLMNLLGIPGTVRASFAPYNRRDDIDRLFTALEKAAKFL